MSYNGYVGMEKVASQLKMMDADQLRAFLTKSNLAFTPADDKGASPSAIGLSLPIGAATFATTHWSIVLEAQGESLAAEEALEKLCRTYWYPLYGFVRQPFSGSLPVSLPLASFESH